jgi:hypothetical protein
MNKEQSRFWKIIFHWFISVLRIVRLFLVSEIAIPLFLLQFGRWNDLGLLMMAELFLDS